MSSGGVRGPALSLVVPVYDEEQRLAEYGKALVEFIADRPDGSELIFVDDGSTDGTARCIEQLIESHSGVAVRLLRRSHEGKGAAVVAGLRAARADYAGFCDLDLSTPLDQFERVVHVATRSPVLAVASRDLAASRILHSQSVVREALGRAYNRLLQATVTPGVVDTQCGAKVAARPIWQAILPHCRETGYAWDAEAIAVAQAIGVEVQEVPVAWRHDDRSKVRVMRDGTAMVYAAARIWRTAREARVAHQRAAAVAASGEEFDADNAELLLGADRSHWWFRSKAAFVATALRRTQPTSGLIADRGWLVDCGAGSGGVTVILGWDPERTLVVEANETLVRHARRRYGLPGVQARVDRVPLAEGTAAVVCLLDVIEHLVDPLPALREAARLLAPGGRVVINVPAHGWLWSAADEQLGHVRRYSRPALSRELAATGFRPVLMSHVFSWLLVPVWLTRRVTGRGRAELGLDRRSPVLDRAAMVLTAIERELLGRIPLPFGTSILCVAEPAPGEGDRSEHE